MPILPFPEYKPDLSDYESTTTQSVLNVIPRGDGYGPFQDHNDYTAALAAACRGAFRAIKSDGSIAIFAATSTKLYILDNSALTWTDASQASGTYSALPSTDQWQFAQFGNDVIAVQANEPPQVYTLGSSSEFADLGGSPPQAKYISIVGRFVVLSGLTSQPYRIQWSGLNADTTWTSGTNSSDYQDLPDGGVVRGVAGGEYGVIFQDAALRRMTYAPGSPAIFQIERISEDRGLYAPYSIIRSGDKVFFLSGHGFMMMPPTGYPQPIGKERVDRTFLEDLDTANLQLVIGLQDPRSTRVYWSYKSANGASGLFDKLLCYDPALDKWTTINMVGEYVLSMSAPGVTLEGLDTVSASLDALTASLDSFATSVTPDIGGFDSSHVFGFYNGTNLEATLETAEQGTDGRRIFVRGGRIITDASTAYLSLSKRESPQAARTYTDEALIDARGYASRRASTRYSRGKVRIPSGTTWTFVNGVEPDFTLEGMR